MNDISKLLIQEPPLQVLPTLAKLIGLNQAIVLQQLHYLLSNPRSGKQLGSKRWVFNTYEQWQRDFFPFWCLRTVKSTFAKLAKRGLIISCQPEGRISRRKYYSVDSDKLVKLFKSAKSARSCIGQLLPVPITETSTKEGKGTLSSARGSASAMPLHHAPRVRYPDTEEEMVAMLDSLKIEYNPDYDGNFFETMDRCGWVINGDPIWDWPAVYQARLEVTSPGNGSFTGNF